MPSAGIGFYIVIFIVTPGSKAVFYRLLSGKWTNAADGDDDTGIKVYDASDIERLSVNSAQNPFGIESIITQGQGPTGRGSNVSEVLSTSSLRSFKQVDDNAITMLINNSKSSGSGSGNGNNAAVTSSSAGIVIGGGYTSSTSVTNSANASNNNLPIHTNYPVIGLQRGLPGRDPPHYSQHNHGLGGVHNTAGFNSGLEINSRGSMTPI
jgi:hypothetical protein